MATTKELKLFDRVLDRKKPFLKIKDFGNLTFTHPDDLPKRINLQIGEIQREMQYERDRLQVVVKDTEDLEKSIENNTFERDLPEKRKQLNIEIQEIQANLQQLTVALMGFLAQLKPGELEAKIDALYQPIVDENGVEDESKIPQIDKLELIDLLWEKITEALEDYNQKKEAEKPQNGFNPENEKKETETV